jgi:hypothetical protein
MEIAQEELVKRNLPKSLLARIASENSRKFGRQAGGKPASKFCVVVASSAEPSASSFNRNPSGNSDENAVLASCDFKRAADETCRTRQK